MYNLPVWMYYINADCSLTSFSFSKIIGGKRKNRGLIKSTLTLTNAHENDST